MKLSANSAHAVRALLDLAIHGSPGDSTKAADVAARTGIPEKLLDAVFARLRAAGLVVSKRGPSGGHRLARQPSAITLASVLSAIDHRVLERPRGAARTSMEAPGADQFWGRLETSMRVFLDGTTLEDLRRDAVAELAIDYSI